MIDTAPPAPRRLPDTARRDRTRRHLLDAAFRLVGNARGRSLRIEELCAAARISRGSFYNYFSSMEELFVALAYDLTHEFTLAVLAEMGRMESAAEQTDAGMRYYLDRARHDPGWGWAMVNIGATGPLFGVETFASALATVERGIARGEFRVAGAQVGRDLVLGTCHAAILTHLREGSPDDWARSVSRAVLRGLGIAADEVERIVGRALPPL